MSQQRTNTLIIVALVPVLGLGLVFSILLLGGEEEDPCAPNGSQSAVSIDPDSVPEGPIAGYGHEQLVNAAYIMQAAHQLGLSVRDQTIGVMTAMGESDLVVLDQGDAAGPDSRGLFQQRDDGAWGTYEERMDPFTSATSFFQALMKVEDRDTLEPTLAAHRVQRNADPYHYAKYWQSAVEIVQGLAGVTSTPASKTQEVSRYSLGPVQPQTAAVANTLGAQFGITTVGGWRDPATEVYDPQGHPAGLALDFMTNDIPDGTTVGDRLADHITTHATDLGVSYVIWRQRIWSPDRAAEGWRPMADRGSPTQNHMDHVHLSLTGHGSMTLADACGTGTTPGTVGGQGWSAPASGPISSGYGPRWGGWHYGTDFAPPCDAPIWAAAAGTVTFAGPAAGYGNWIKISHDQGVVTTYGHMFTAGVLVHTGDVVQAGQQIGRVGTAGDSTGCHLHFEVLTQGTYTDPLPFLAQRGVQIPGGQS